jgi:hypothetical protein
MRTPTRGFRLRRAASRLLVGVAALLLLTGYLGWKLVFPTPEVEPVSPDLSHPFAAAFTITNPSPFVAMRNVLWHCVMTPLGTNSRIPIFDLGQFQTGRQGTEIPPNGSERHDCHETEALRQEGTFEIFISLDFDTTLNAMSMKRVLKRHLERAGLTWRIEHDGGRWLE